MTCRPDPKDFAAGRLHADSVEAPVRLRAAPAGYPATHLAAMLRSIVAGLRWCARRYLCALDVSRRWQAAVEHAKYCDLFYDPATGIVFGTQPREHGRRCGGGEACRADR